MSQRWEPERPYNDLPTLPPAIDPETRAALKQCIGARAALAELKQAAELIPNSGILINTLPILEARSSSEIENIVTTSDELFRYIHAEAAAAPATLEALRYRHAPLEGFTSLNTTRKNDQAGWEQWLLFMLRGIEETASWTADKIAAIRQLEESTTRFVRDTLPKLYSHELMNVIFEQPYCRIANVVEAKIAGRQAASRYLKALVSAGVLQERTFGREKLFVNSKLLTLLTRDDAFNLPRWLRHHAPRSRA